MSEIAVRNRRKVGQELRLTLGIFVFGWAVSLLGPVLRERKSIVAMVDFAKALQDE